MLRRLGVVLGVVWVAQAAPARAEPLPTDDYTLDVYQGPVLAPIRVTSLGGAYAGYAEGIAGLSSNAAAPAVRAPQSIDDFAWDLSASVSIPLQLFENDDFDNDGGVDADYSGFVFVSAGGMLQKGPFGVGVEAAVQRYSLTGPAGEETDVFLGRYTALAGVSLAERELSLGAGVRALTLGLSTPDAELTWAGVAPQLGLLVRPDWVPFRFGMTYRFAVQGAGIGAAARAPTTGLHREGDLVLPEQVVLPWEIDAGVAIELGPRPLNPSFLEPRDGEPTAARAARRARVRSWPRPRITLLSSLLVTGPVARGVRVEQFLAQADPSASSRGVVGSSGASMNFSPRFGVETEPVEDWLAVRAGSYYEPSRSGGVGRQHFTFGSELRLFSTTYFGLVEETTYSVEVGLDLAPRYESASATIGVWY